MKIFVEDVGNSPILRSLWEVNPKIIFGVDTRFERYRVGSRNERLTCNFFIEESSRDEFYLYAMKKLFPGSGSVCYYATFVVLENNFLRYEVLYMYQKIAREKAVTLMQEYYLGYETPLTVENVVPIKNILSVLS